MSSGRNRFIVNSGSPKFAAREFRRVARSTAAHSTVTVDETSSSRMIRSYFCRASILAGATVAEVERSNDQHGNDWLRSVHDGYLSGLGYVHERQIGLNNSGNKIKGHDTLSSLEGLRGQRRVEAVARFHIHPSITLFRQDKETVLMVAADGEAWAFSAPGLTPTIEEDIFFADASGFRSSQQIVIAFSPPELSEIRWMLKRME
jgi:uncharacterized heparinase superfamily protein